MRGKLLEKEWFDVAGEIYGNVLVLHLDLYSWSPSVYKELLLTIDDLRRELPSRGIDCLMALVENDPKLIKFETMLGFKIAVRNDELVLMYQECYVE